MDNFTEMEEETRVIDAEMLRDFPELGILQAHALANDREGFDWYLQRAAERALQEIKFVF